MDVKRSLTLPIYGLDCPGTSPAEIEHALVSIHGVVRAYVNPTTETAYIDYDASEIDPETLAQAIDKAGYRTGAPIEP